MAEDSDQGVTINEIETINGHDINFLLPVRNLVALQSNPFVFEHFNNCRELPTTWFFRVNYEQVPDTGKIRCSVSLKRTDFGEGYVDTAVSVSYLDKDGGDFRFSAWICAGQMFSGHTIEGFVEEHRHPGYISHIFNLGLVLKIFMSIRYCHTSVQYYAKEVLGSDKRKIRLSKM